MAINNFFKQVTKNYIRKKKIVILQAKQFIYWILKLVIMKKICFITGLLIFVSIISYSQNNKKGRYSIECTSFYLLDEKMGRGSDGVIVHFQGNNTIQEYRYKLDEADIYLIKGTDTLAHKKSFEGSAVFKNVAPGLYNLLYSKKGYNSRLYEIEIIDKSIRHYGDLKENVK